jgi:hypothetical protein
MDPFLAWIESTAFSTWMREDPSILAFPAVLALHTIGLALVVGINVALDLRILGVATDIPVPEMRQYLPVLWIGLAVNAASGLALLAAYPTKALTDPVFYLKLTLIAAALWLLARIRRTVFHDASWEQGEMAPRMKRMAVASLVCWAGAITAGRLLAYTYTRLTTEF